MIFINTLLALALFGSSIYFGIMESRSIIDQWKQFVKSIKDDMMVLEESTKAAESLGFLNRIFVFVTRKTIPDRAVFTVPSEASPHIGSVEDEDTWWGLVSPMKWIRNEEEKFLKTLEEYKVTIQAAERFLGQCEKWNELRNGLLVEPSTNTIPLENNIVYKYILKYYEEQCAGGCPSLMSVPKRDFRLQDHGSPFIWKYTITLAIFYVLFYLGYPFISRRSKAIHNKNVVLLKQKGDDLLASKKFDEAAKQYTEAIKLVKDDPTTQFDCHYARSTCYQELNEINLACNDLIVSTKIKQDFSEGYIRHAELLLSGGFADDATEILKKIPEKDQDLEAVKELKATTTKLKEKVQEIEKYDKERKFINAFYSARDAHEICPRSVQYFILIPKYIALAGNIEKAKEILVHCFEHDAKEREVNVELAKLVLKENPSMSKVILDEILESESKEVSQLMATVEQFLLKEKANKLFRDSKYQKALALYDKALTLDVCHHDKTLKEQMTATLHFNCAMSYFKQQKYMLALDACIIALQIDANYTKAQNLKATCTTKLDESCNTSYYVTQTHDTSTNCTSTGST